MTIELQAEDINQNFWMDLKIRKKENSFEPGYWTNQLIRCNNSTTKCTCFQFNSKVLPGSMYLLNFQLHSTPLPKANSFACQNFQSEKGSLIKIWNNSLLQLVVFHFWKMQFTVNCFEYHIMKWINNGIYDNVLLIRIFSSSIQNKVSIFQS